MEETLKDPLREDIKKTHDEPFDWLTSPISGPLVNYFGNGSSLLFTEDYCYLSTRYLKDWYVQDEATILNKLFTHTYLNW